QNRFPASKPGYALPVLMEMTVVTVISDYKRAKRDADVSAPCAACPARLKARFQAKPSGELRPDLLVLRDDLIRHVGLELLELCRQAFVRQREHLRREDRRVVRAVD